MSFWFFFRRHASSSSSIFFFALRTGLRICSFYSRRFMAPSIVNWFEISYLRRQRKQNIHQIIMGNVAVLKWTLYSTCWTLGLHLQVLREIQKTPDSFQVCSVCMLTYIALDQNINLTCFLLKLDIWHLFISLLFSWLFYSQYKLQFCFQMNGKYSV